jgi:glutathione S-transferase
MLELFQTEWCRGSWQIRGRLSELGLDYVSRWVPDDPADRDALEEATGVRTVPVLLFDDGSICDGADEILDYLAELPSVECDSMPFSREPESLLVGVPMS